MIVCSRTPAMRRLLVAVAVIGSVLPLPSSAGAQVAPEPGVLVFERDFDLWTAHPDGSDQRRIVAHGPDGGFVWEPDLSPDGQRVLFASCSDFQRNGPCVIEEIGVDGSGRRTVPLPSDLQSVGRPSWSPDGTQFAFVSLDGGRAKIARLDGTDIRDLGPGGTVEWSPTGSVLVAAADETSTRPSQDPTIGQLVTLRLVPLNGQPSRALRTVEGGVVDAVWSPDGSRIALTLALPHSVGIVQPDFV